MERLEIPSGISIDSLKLRIPLSEVEVINKDLLTYWFQISEHSEIGEEEFKRKRMTIKNNGITTSYLIQKRKCYGEIEVESLLILFNSKILETGYFEGITEKNIHEVYSRIIRQKVINITFENFLNAACTDTDLKKDFVLKSSESLENTVKFFVNETKPSKKADTGVHTRIGKSGVHAQWMKRREAATTSKPFVKMYSKDLEFLNSGKGEKPRSSNVFYNTYFESYNLPPILRQEVTIKDKKQFKYMIGKQDDEFQQFTLKDILDMDQETKHELLSTMFLKHLEQPNFIENKDSRNLNQSEVFAIELLKAVGDLAICLQKVTKRSSTKQQAKRSRDILISLWYVECSDLVNSPENVDMSVYDTIYKS